MPYSAGRLTRAESLALRRATEDRLDLARGLVEAGHAAWVQGEHGVTQSYALEALGLFREGNDRQGALAALESLGLAALAQGRKDHAARLMGAVEAQREACRSLPWWWRRPEERIGEAVRAAALEQEFAAAWAEGRAMTLVQAIRYAMEDGSAPPSATWR
jgi:hypothetical protein